MFVILSTLALVKRARKQIQTVRAVGSPHYISRVRQQKQVDEGQRGRVRAATPLAEGPVGRDPAQAQYPLLPLEDYVPSNCVTYTYLC